jgi:hypothetical protein
MLSPTRFRVLYNQLNAPVKKVYDAVPATDAWDHSQIIAELRRNGHSMRDMSAVLGCLDTLRRNGLVAEPKNGLFIRVHIKEPKAVATKEVLHPLLEPVQEPTIQPDNQQENKMPMSTTPTTMRVIPKATPKQPPIERLSTLATQADAYAAEAKTLAEKMKTLASELETVAIEIEDDVQETAKMAGQLKQLKNLLKGLDD